MSHLLCEWCHPARMGLRRSMRHRRGVMAPLPQHDSPQLLTPINSNGSGTDHAPGLTFLQPSSFPASTLRWAPEYRNAALPSPLVVLVRENVG
jgi:hypothetical protein